VADDRRDDRRRTDHAHYCRPRDVTPLDTSGEPHRSAGVRRR
jgi:hypothetical protein